MDTRGSAYLVPLHWSDGRVHLVVLERERFESEYFAAPLCDRRTKVADLVQTIRSLS